MEGEIDLEEVATPPHSPEELLPVPPEDLLPASPEVLLPETTGENQDEGAVVHKEGVVDGGDFISLDRTSYSIGETVMVTWQITTRPLHERDFIVMVEVDDGPARDHVTCNSSLVTTSDVTMDRLLDSRIRGDTSVNGGLLQWALTENIFPKCKLLQWNIPNLFMTHVTIPSGIPY